jgi:hypothetical protein
MQAWWIEFASRSTERCFVSITWCFMPHMTSHICWHVAWLARPIKTANDFPAQDQLWYMQLTSPSIETMSWLIKAYAEAQIFHVLSLLFGPFDLTLTSPPVLNSSSLTTYPMFMHYSVRFFIKFYNFLILFIFILDVTCCVRTTSYYGAYSVWGCILAWYGGARSPPPKRTATHALKSAIVFLKRKRTDTHKNN